MGATEIISFEEKLKGLRDAGFTEEQVKAVWELVAYAVTEVAKRIVRQS